MKKFYSLVLMLFVVLITNAQIQDPVKVKTEFNKISDTEAEIIFNATIDAGWHLYSTELGSSGPISATFIID